MSSPFAVFVCVTLNLIITFNVLICRFCQWIMISLFVVFVCIDYSIYVWCNLYYLVPVVASAVKFFQYVQGTHIAE